MFPRTAIVTGGASGIGAAVIALLEAEGCQVTSLDLANGFDVGDAAAWADVGPAELAFLNAGVTTGEADVARLTDEGYRRTVGANVDGVVFGTRRMAQVMERGSGIVATASLAGLVPTPQDPIYSLTKHAVVGFVRSVAPQLAERGIRCNAVAPGFADTPILGSGRAALEQAGFPLLAADDVARAVLLAARSEETGQVWAVQPGRDPIRYRFPNVPGPRVEGHEGQRPPDFAAT